MNNQTKNDKKKNSNTKQLNQEETRNFHNLLFIQFIYLIFNLKEFKEF